VVYILTWHWAMWCHSNGLRRHVLMVYVVTSQHKLCVCLELAIVPLYKLRGREAMWLQAWGMPRQFRFALLLLHALPLCSSLGGNRHLRTSYRCWRPVGKHTVCGWSVILKEHRTSWQAHGTPAGLETPLMLSNPNIHYLINKSPLLVYPEKKFDSKSDFLFQVRHRFCVTVKPD